MDPGEAIKSAKDCGSNRLPTSGSNAVLFWFTGAPSACCRTWSIHFCTSASTSPSSCSAISVGRFRTSFIACAAPTGDGVACGSNSRCASGESNLGAASSVDKGALENRCRQ